MPFEPRIYSGGPFDARGPDPRDTTASADNFLDLSQTELELPDELNLLAEQLSADSIWLSQSYPARGTIIPSLVNDALIAAARQRHPYRVALAQACGQVRRAAAGSARLAADGIPWRRAADFAWSHRPIGYRAWHGWAACLMVGTAAALAVLPNWNELAPPAGDAAGHAPAFAGIEPTPAAGTAPAFNPHALAPHGPLPALLPNPARNARSGSVPMFLFQELTPSEQEGVLDLLDESKLPHVSVEI